MPNAKTLLHFTFKTPDAVRDIVAQYRGDSQSKPSDGYKAWNMADLDEDLLEEESINYAPSAMLKDMLDRYIRYGETITIEFNIKDGTARVVPKDER